MSLHDHLNCIEVHPDLGFRNVLVSPFERSPDYRRDWWDDVPRNYLDGDIQFLSFRIDTHEVARARLLLNQFPLPGYAVPRLASDLVTIDRLEVAGRHIMRGHGTRAVAAIVERYPGAGLLAYSEGADGFWGRRLGWERFEHSEGTRSYFPLYVRAPQSGEI